MKTTLSKMKFAIFLSIPILFFLFMLEIGLGIWGDTQPNRVLCYDPILGRSYCPNTNGYLKNNQVNSYIEVNADGLLGKNYPIARTPGKLRVAVLGDSFTSGEAVAADKKFVGVWETKLSEIFLPGVEVINFGIGGTGTWQQLQRFHVKVRKYKPDLTVLAFCWCNDVGDNRSQYISKADDRNPLLDEYEINNWTKLQVRRKYFNKWIWNHSNLYQFTRTRYNHLEHFVKRLFLPDYMKATAPPSHLLKEAAYDRQSNELQQSIDRQKKILQNNVLKNDVVKNDVVKKDVEKIPGGVKKAEKSIEKNTKSIDIKFFPDFKDTSSIHDDLFFFDSEGWKLSRKLIIKLHSEVRENGSKLAVIHFGGNSHLHSFVSLLPIIEFERFLSDQGIEYFNVYELFAQMKVADLEKYFIPNDGHFSEAGHAKFAGMAIKFLTKLLQTKP